MVQHCLKELMRDCEFAPSFEAVLSSFRSDLCPPTSLWGISPVAPIHLGYDALIVYQKNLITLGSQHTVLLADLHTMMSHGLDFSQVSSRALYYECYLKNYCALDARFVKGSDFQTRVDYTENLLSLVSRTKVSSVRDTIPSDTWRGVGTDARMVSAYIYSVMQCLDAWYLGTDVVLAEPGQQKIYELMEYLPIERNQNQLLFKNLHSRVSDWQPSFVYVPSSHDIQGKRLVDSSAATRISIHETRNSLEQKIHKMFAPPAGQPMPEGRTNALLEHFRYSVFPWIKEPIKVMGEDEQVHYFESYHDFVKAYKSGQIHPVECKKTLIETLWQRLRAIRRIWGQSIVDWVNEELAIGLTK